MNPPNPSAKILIVDDNSKNLQLVGNLLRSIGYQLAFATDGQQALDLLNGNNEFDLIILDIFMPVRDGIETCKAIRQNKATSDIPVIFLTALTDNDYMIKAFEAGARDYITKPFNALELKTRIATQLEIKANRDQLKMMNNSLEILVADRTHELLQTNAELEKANSELKSLDEAKTEFLRIISHELNTPLNGIIGFTKLLKERIDSPELSELVKYLETSAVRLERFSSVSLLITELKTLEKVKRSAIDITKIINRQLKGFSEQINNQHIITNIQKNNDSPPLLCNERLIGICFDNIIENAINHTPMGGEICITWSANSHVVKCMISDNGPGFSKDAIQKKFRLFAPGQKHIDKNEGLGLALCKLIMDAHHGAIDIYNKSKGGAVVELTIPTITALKV